MQLVRVYDEGPVLPLDPDGVPLTARFLLFSDREAPYCLALSSDADGPDGVCVRVRVDELELQANAERITFDELPLGAKQALWGRYAGERIVDDLPEPPPFVPAGPRRRPSPLA